MLSDPECPKSLCFKSSAMLARFGSTYTTVTVSRSASDSKYLFSKTCQDLNRYIVVGGVRRTALLSTRAV